MPPPQTLTWTCIAALTVHTWAMQPPGDPNNNPLPPQQHAPANGQPSRQPSAQQPPTNPPTTHTPPLQPPGGHPHNPPSYAWQATHPSTGGTTTTARGGYSLVPQAGIQVGPQGIPQIHMPQPPYQLQQHPHHGAPQGPYQQQALPHTQHSQLQTPAHPQHTPQLPAQPTLPIQAHGHTFPPQTPTTATTPTQQTPQQPYLGFGTARYAPPYDPATDPWRTPSNSPNDTPRDTDDPPHHPQPQTTNPLNTATATPQTPQTPADQPAADHRAPHELGKDTPAVAASQPSTQQHSRPTTGHTRLGRPENADTSPTAQGSTATPSDRDPPHKVASVTDSQPGAEAGPSTENLPSRPTTQHAATATADSTSATAGEPLGGHATPAEHTTAADPDPQHELETKPHPADANPCEPTTASTAATAPDQAAPRNGDPTTQDHEAATTAQDTAAAGDEVEVDDDDTPTNPDDDTPTCRSKEGHGSQRVQNKACKYEWKQANRQQRQPRPPPPGSRRTRMGDRVPTYARP